MSKTFQFEDLVDCEIDSVDAEFGHGSGYDDDYVGFNLKDGRQLQLVSDSGTLVKIDGNLENMLDSPIVSATVSEAECCLEFDHIVTKTFTIVVKGPISYPATTLHFIGLDALDVAVEMK